ncbi:hypothetical protein [Humibacter ginsenosidimutans]|uniref:Gram-positive cocci surface proteins LPxTG domain-containing protein n=1 Tax=Humibacter ginsenosidimutans TaxID=2599293 RepID=A0A5B8M8U8_9MICO|nr:hypothetical protein [Humibacter ginsenosidimutans]QDZ16042.1 hypothetical protein FPZ11_15825 [Humibacter ginsenosidimutans]
MDVTADPILSVDVPATTGKWAIKLNDSANAGGNDVAELQHDSSATGHFDFDIASVTGWTGSHTFWVKLYEISAGGSSSTTFSSLTVHSGAAPRAAATANSNQWFPDRLAFDAKFSSGSLDGFDTFHDTNSVTRFVDAQGLEGADGEGTLTIAGSYTSSAQYDATSNVITLLQSHETIAIALPSAAKVEFYPSTGAMQFGDGGTASPVADDGVWSADVGGTGTYAVGIAFAVGGDTAAAKAEAEAAATVKGAGDDDSARQTFWNAYLAKVPAPSDFSIHDVQNLGVTADDVRAMYYQAFVDLEQNVLPVMSESSSHAQIATGKPSLYMGGPQGASASASWDSLLGMQDLVYVDPDVAWDAFDGIMDAVGSDGALDGESLPARKAQTAWVLYQVTGDRQKLADVYAAVKRNLAWEAENPHWNYGGTPASQVDAEFVASLIVDYGYAQQIADALGQTADVAGFKQAQNAELADYEKWFFPADGSTVYQHYLDGSKPDDAGLTMYVTTGLHVPGLSAADVTALQSRFAQDYDLNQQLAGLAQTAIKAPDEMYMVYGLLDHGMVSDADGVINSLTRDIVRTGTFAEVYQQSSGNIDDVPLARSVYPSLFGVANLIDNVWMENGYRADQGGASVLRLPGSTGGITGLTSMGKRLSISLSASDGTATVSGDVVSPSPCTFDIASGQTIAIADAKCVSDPSNGSGSAPGSGTKGSSSSRAGVSADPEGLARTGTDLSGWLTAAVLLLAAGTTTVLVRRRRNRAE